MKELAAREGRTVQEVANDLLRQALVQQRQPSKPKLVLRGWKAAELPGVDLLDRNKLFDLMDRR
jgi:plasmid stability protein